MAQVHPARIEAAAGAAMLPPARHGGFHPLHNTLTLTHTPTDPLRAAPAPRPAHTHVSPPRAPPPPHTHLDMLAVLYTDKHLESLRVRARTRGVRTGSRRQQQVSFAGHVGLYSD